MSKQLGQKISPTPMSTNISVVDLIDNYFTAYNSARLREICQLLSKEVLTEGVTVGVRPFRCDDTSRIRGFCASTFDSQRLY
jgi:deoxyhypusine synthase